MVREEIEEYLYFAMSIGEKMLISGAEVGRVEDTISRICYAYGAKKVDVLSMNNAIITTVELEDREVLTQTKRISGLHIDLDRLDRLNCLSRKICERRLPAEDIRKEFDGLCQGKGYSFGVQLFASALISGAFAAFFGGTVRDLLVSALIGIVLKCTEEFLVRQKTNSFVTILLCSCLGGLLANLAVMAQVGNQVDMISLGNIILFIPGVVFVNSMRDMFSKDIVTGLVGFVESSLTTMVMAMGFALSNLWF